MGKTADLFIRAQHAELLKKLNAWDVAYHQNDAPIVDDATYDAAKSEKKLVPMTTFTLIAPRYALMGCPSTVGVVVMINLSMFKRF